jgi:hypothetical protein
MQVATAHLVTADQTACTPCSTALAELRERHGVAHATLQVGPRHTGCDEVGW